MKIVKRISIQTALLFLLFCATSCESVLNDMSFRAMELEKLGQIMIERVTFRPLARFTLTYDTQGTIREAHEGDLVVLDSVLMDNASEVTFTITNEGTEAITVSEITLTEPDDGGRFTLGGISLPAAIDVGNSDTFTITFQTDYAGDGYRGAIVSMNTGEKNRPFIFSVACQRSEVPLANLLVLLGSETVTDGYTHDMGTTDNIPASPTSTFTIKNTGTSGSTLVINSVTTSDPVNNHFNVVSAPPSVAYGSSDYIEISFDPPVEQSTKEYDADMTISYEDGVHPTGTFTVHLTGTMMPVPSMEVYDVIVSDVVPVVGTSYAYNFGSQLYHTESTARVFRIKSARTKNLTIHSITSNNQNFIVAPVISSDQELATGASMNISITYHPQTTDPHTGTVAITSDDPDTGNFTINLAGCSGSLPVPLDDPYEDSYGRGQFLSSLVPLVDEIGDTVPYTYLTPLTEIYDTGTSGPLATDKFIRMVCNGQNVNSIVGLTSAGATGPYLVPWAVNLSSSTMASISPPADKFYIDPVRGKFILPRPIFWSKLAAHTKTTNSPQGGTIPAEISIVGYSPTYSSTYYGTTDLFNHHPGGGYSDDSLIHLCWDTVINNNKFMIYPFGDPGITNISRGTLSIVTRVGHDYGEADAIIVIGNHTISTVIAPVYGLDYGKLCLDGTCHIKDSDTTIKSKWVHWYIVWDQAGGLGVDPEGNPITVRAFYDYGSGGTELYTTATFTPGSIYFKGFAFRRPDNVGSDSAGVDDLKIWNHVILPGGSRDWNNLYSSTPANKAVDQIHYIYGDTKGYKPDVTGAPNGVGYYKLP